MAVNAQALLAAGAVPLAIWVLWRFQAVSVNVLRRVLARTARLTRPLYMVVSWFGTFIHEVSHASVLLLSGHGIKEFRAGVEEGHVLPARVQKGGVGFLFFLVAALAPLFVPPALVLAGLVWTVDGDLIPWQAAGPGLEPARQVLQDTLLALPKDLALALARIDLADPWQAGVFALVLVGIPGSRPSHVKGSRFHGTEDQGDVAVLRRRIRRNPLPFILFLGLLYGAYLVLVATLDEPWSWKAYWYPFEALAAVALTGLLLAAFGVLWWSLWNLSWRAMPAVAWLAPLAFVGVQVGARSAGTGWGPMATNGVAVAAWAALAVALAVALPRRRW